MCTVSAPKPKSVDESKTTPVYMHNAYLDSLGMGAESRGRNSLRIDMGSAPAAPPQPGSSGFSGGGLPPIDMGGPPVAYDYGFGMVKGINSVGRRVL